MRQDENRDSGDIGVRGELRWWVREGQALRAAPHPGLPFRLAPVACLTLHITMNETNMAS